MNSDGVGQEILSHHYHTHCMTFYNNFLSTSPSVNNELNDKCFLGIVYHVSILLISEKKSKKKPNKNLSNLNTWGPATSSLPSSFPSFYSTLVSVSSSILLPK